MKYTDEYIKQIEDGKIIVNHWIWKQLQRMKNFEDKYIYKPEEVEIVIRFLENLPNPHAVNENLKLFLPQKVWLESAFAFWYYDDEVGEELRLTRENLWQISRGSGKTTISAGISLYGVTSDGEPTSECYCMGTTNDQAGQLFRTAMNMMSKSETLEQHLHKGAGNIIQYKPNNSFLRILTNDYGTMDGLNHHFGVFDEPHAYTEDSIKVFNDGGFRKRKNPMTFYISTNGVVRGLVYDKLVHRAKKILSGQAIDDQFSAFIYELDSIEEVHNEEMWQKAIPLLGDLITKKVIRRDIINAQDQPDDQVELLTKTFGLSMNSYHSFLSDEVCKGNRELMNHKLFEGPDDDFQSVILGLDMSQVNDLCSVAIMIPTMYEDQVQFQFKTLKFIPRQGFDRLPKKWKAKYEEWESQGLLIIHDQAYNKPKYLFETYIRDYLDSNRLIPVAMGYDPYQASDIISEFEDNYGIEAYRIPQNVKNLSTPMKESRSLLNAKLWVFDDEVTTWNYRNLVAKTDANKNVYPNKKEANEKIDEYISTLLAYIAFKADETNLGYTFGLNDFGDDQLDYYDLI